MNLFKNVYPTFEVEVSVSTVSYSNSRKNANFLTQIYLGLGTRLASLNLLHGLNKAFCQGHLVKKVE